MNKTLPKLVSQLELRDSLDKIRLESFRYMQLVSSLDRQALDNAGYKNKSNADAIKIILDNTTKVIEAAIRKYEKENPD